MRVVSTLLPLLALTASLGVAAQRGALEEEIARVVAHRDALRAERGQLVETAAALAQRISAAPRADDRVRAGSALSRQLRELDRLSDRLDAVEQRIAEANRALRRLLREFDQAAEGEEQALEARARLEGAQSVAAPLAALAGARDRLGPLRQNEAFRPPLEVVLDPQDGPSDLEGRIILIEGERQRIALRITEIENEGLLLATRLRAKRQWAHDLGAARREAGGGIELLDQIHERTEATLLGLTTRSEQLVRERAELQNADARLAATRQGAVERLRALVPRRAAP